MNQEERDKLNNVNDFVNTVQNSILFGVLVFIALLICSWFGWIP